MKVKRLIEAPDASDIYYDDGTTAAEDAGATTLSYNVGLKDVIDAFKNGKLRNKNGKDIKVDQITATKMLLNLFGDNGSIKSYGGNSTKNLKDVLSSFSSDFVKYFLDCLGIEKLGSENNKILTALSSPYSSKLIKGNRKNFSTLFNAVEANGNSIDNKYLSDQNSILYNEALYTLDNQQLINSIVNKTSKGEVTSRQAVDNINNSDFSLYLGNSSLNNDDKQSSFNVSDLKAMIRRLESVPFDKLKYELENSLGFTSASAQSLTKALADHLIKK